MYSVFWGVLGLIWVKDLYPVVSKTIERIPKKLGHTVTVLFTLFMVADMAVSAGAVYRRYQRENGIPASNAVQSFFDSAFPNSKLDILYPHMEFVGRPERPGNVVLSTTNQIIP